MKMLLLLLVLLLAQLRHRKADTPQWKGFCPASAFASSAWILGFYFLPATIHPSSSNITQQPSCVPSKQNPITPGVVADSPYAAGLPALACNAENSGVKNLQRAVIRTHIPRHGGCLVDARSRPLGAPIRTLNPLIRRPLRLNHSHDGTFCTLFAPKDGCPGNHEFQSVLQPPSLSTYVSLPGW